MVTAWAGVVTGAVDTWGAGAPAARGKAAPGAVSGMRLGRRWEASRLRSPGGEPDVKGARWTAMRQGRRGMVRRGNRRTAGARGGSRRARPRASGNGPGATCDLCTRLSGRSCASRRTSRTSRRRRFCERSTTSARSMQAARSPLRREYGTSRKHTRRVGFPLPPIPRPAIFYAQLNSAGSDPIILSVPVYFYPGPIIAVQAVFSFSSPQTRLSDTRPYERP